MGSSRSAAIGLVALVCACGTYQRDTKIDASGSSGSGGSGDSTASGDGAMSSGPDMKLDIPPRLQKLVESFDTHFVSSICANDYVAFFDDALMQVAEGCAQFTPG